MPVTIDFSRIAFFDSSQDAAFEELVCQLARADFGYLGEFHRVDGAGGDGGVEAYLVLPDGTEYGWQAKYYPTGRLTPARQREIVQSLETTVRIHERCTRWYLALPLNLTARTGRGGQSERGWWDSLSLRYRQKGIHLILWDKSFLVGALIHPHQRGRLEYWFGLLTLDQEWFTRQFHVRARQLHTKYLPGLHVPGRVDQLIISSAAGTDPLGRLERELDGRVDRLMQAIAYMGTALCLHEFPKIYSIKSQWERLARTLRNLLHSLSPFLGYPLSESESRQAQRLVRTRGEKALDQFLFALQVAHEACDSFDYGDAPLMIEEDPDPQSAVEKGILDSLRWNPRFSSGLPRDFYLVAGGIHFLQIRESAEVGLADSVDETFMGYDSVEKSEYWDDELIDEEYDAWDEDYLLEFDAELEAEKGEAQGAPGPNLNRFDEVESRESQFTEETQTIGRYVKGESRHYRGGRGRFYHEAVHDLYVFVGRLLDDLSKAFLPSLRTAAVIAPPGTGKTHVFADVTRRLVEAGKPALLLTGDLFPPDRSIETSIMDIVGRPGLNWDDFLAALEVAGETHRGRAAILIDALNEAPSIGLWRSRLSAFETNLVGSDYVFLATSCRSTYRHAIWADTEPANTVGLHRNPEDMAKMVHRYLQHYRIRVQAPVAAISDLFISPLYLRLFCTVYGDPNRAHPLEVQVGQESIFDVFEEYLRGAARRIADLTEMDWREVHRVCSGLGHLFWQSPYPYVPWDDVTALLSKRFGHIPWSRSVAHGILSEELLLRREMEGENTEVAVFSYDLLGDYLVTRYGVLGGRPWSDAVLEAIPWSTVESHPRAQGILEVLALLLPQYCAGRQLWEVCPSTRQAADACLESLARMAPERVRETDRLWLEEQIKRGQVGRGLRVIYQCAMVKDHLLDVNYLYGWIRIIRKRRWARWLSLHPELSTRLKDRFIREMSSHLAILVWLVYQGTGEDDLLNLVLEFTNASPGAVPRIRAYEL